MVHFSKYVSSTVCGTISYTVVLQLKDKLKIPVGLHCEVKDVSHLSQNIVNNFEVVQCTLLKKMVSLDLLYFQNVGQVAIME